MEGKEIVSLQKAMDENLVFYLNLFKILKKFKSVSKFSAYITYVRTKTAFVRMVMELSTLVLWKEKS